MTPRKYLMISALSKQMKEIKEAAKKEADKYDTNKPCILMCDGVYHRKSSGYGWGSGPSELVGYKPIQQLPEDIAQEVLKFYKELQTMKSDEIYAAVLKKLLAESKDMDEK